MKLSERLDNFKNFILNMLEKDPDEVFQRERKEG